MKARVLLAALAAFIVAAGCSSEKPSPPPIILISIDTLRADHLGCYGYPRNTSPNFDRLAEAGVFFRDVFSSAPVTAPSHMSLFTSLSPVIHGITNYGAAKGEEAVRTRVLSPRLTTLPEFLQAHGYLTVGLTGGGNVGAEMGFGRGFDHYEAAFGQWVDGEGCYRTGIDDDTRARELVREWVAASRREGKPLFLFFHHTICHLPYLSGPPEHRQRFLRDPVEGLPRDPAIFSPGDKFQETSRAFFSPLNEDDPRHIQHYIDLYDGGVYYSDVILGHLLEELRRAEIYDDALIVVLSDHGEELFDHAGWRHWKLFRETIQVPLVIKFPGDRYAGEEVDIPVQLVDIFPTIADYLGWDGDLPPIQGTSLLGLISGGGTYRGDPVSFSQDGSYLRFSRDGLTFFDQPLGNTRYRLFAGSDQAETENLAEREALKLAALKKEAQRIMAKHRAWRERLLGDEDAILLEADQEKVDELRALGYIN